jgi:hypothetical protein
MNKTLFNIFGVIVLLSALIFVFLEGAFVKELSSLTMVSALFGALFTLVRDYSAFERSLLLSVHQNQLSLGASSHMAKVAFDKHVEFCESYTAKANEILEKIYLNGPAQDAVFWAGELFNIRKKFAVWITEEIDKRLDAFETVIRQMGASAGYVKVTASSDDMQNAESVRNKMRDEHIERMYLHFSELTGVSVRQGEKLTNENAVNAQIIFLRKVLGTEDFVKMRKILVSKASVAISS